MVVRLTSRPLGPHNSRVTKRVLAVDDSVVLRKALELTFAADELELTAVPNLATAVANTSEEPALLLVDTVLDGEDGYAVGKALKERWPGAALLFMTSRHALLDADRARDARADGNIDKPFDTQALVDKARQTISARGAAAAPASTHQVRPPSLAAFRAPAAPAPAHAPGGPRPIAMPTPQAAAAPASVRGASAPPVPSGKFTGSFDGLPAHIPAQPPRAAVPMAQSTASAPSTAPTSVSASSVARQSVESTPSTLPPRAPVAHVNTDDLGAKLEPLGLSSEQQAAVIAVTRELIERVVWEVVPGLAETLIREEIARLTK